MVTVAAPDGQESLPASGDVCHLFLQRSDSLDNLQRGEDGSQQAPGYPDPLLGLGQRESQSAYIGKVHRRQIKYVAAMHEQGKWFPGLVLLGVFHFHRKFQSKEGSCLVEALRHQFLRAGALFLRAPEFAALLVVLPPDTLLDGRELLGREGRSFFR